MEIGDSVYARRLSGEWLHCCIWRRTRDGWEVGTDSGEDFIVPDDRRYIMPEAEFVNGLNYTGGMSGAILKIIYYIGKIAFVGICFLIVGYLISLTPDWFGIGVGVGVLALSVRKMIHFGKYYLVTWNRQFGKVILTFYLVMFSAGFILSENNSLSWIVGGSTVWAIWSVWRNIPR